MFRLALLLVLAGCNQVFDLGATAGRPPIDAQFFDAPADAPFACPPFGTVPAFSPQFVQVLAGSRCHHYTISPAADLAVMVCLVSSPAARIAIRQGPIDSTMVTEISASPPAGANLSFPALSPDGDELWDADSITGTTIHVYATSGTGEWTWSYDIPTAAVVWNGIGTPMRNGAARRAVYFNGDALHELEEVSPRQWVERAVTYQFGLQVESAVHLSPDGLRIVFVATSGPQGSASTIQYADRADLSSKFGTPVRLGDVPPGAETPFLTEDCSRIYFSGLGSVFYVRTL